MDLSVPMCADCEKKEKKIVNVTLLPFVIAGLALFVVGFIPAWLAAPDGVTTQTQDFPLYVGLLVGILSGLVGGTIAEFGARMLFSHKFGQLLLKRPLTLVSMFGDSEDMMGLSVKFAQGRKALLLTFENDDVGDEFKKLNIKDEK